MEFMSGLLLTTTTTANSIASAINATQLNTMFEEVVNLLPIVLPVLVGFMGIRKGISFLLGSLRRA